MDLQYLRKLVKIFDESTVSEIRLEEEGLKLRLAKYAEPPSAVDPQPVIQMQSGPAPVVPTPAAPMPPESAAVEQNTAETPPANAPYVLKSPIVGTFYRAPAPDADPFVLVGTQVSPGQTLCIVEAMKLMNEIESDVSGKVVRVLVDNAQPVEYGQPLFEIETA